MVIENGADFGNRMVGGRILPVYRLATVRLALAGCSGLGDLLAQFNAWAQAYAPSKHLQDSLPVCVPFPIRGILTQEDANMFMEGHKRGEVFPYVL